MLSWGKFRETLCALRSVTWPSSRERARVRECGPHRKGLKFGWFSTVSSLRHNWLSALSEVDTLKRPFDQGRGVFSLSPFLQFRGTTEEDLGGRDV